MHENHYPVSQQALTEVLYIHCVSAVCTQGTLFYEITCYSQLTWYATNA